MDSDALAYIGAVEAADNQALLYPIKAAIDEFVVGCKADGTWSAIAACCLLAGPKTLNGALVPLKGAAPTGVNFVASDHDQFSGLAGNGVNSYINTNRNSNADAQDNNSLAVYTTSSGVAGLFGVTNPATHIGGTQVSIFLPASNWPFRSRLSSFTTPAQGTRATLGNSGFYGISRASASNFVSRFDGSDETITSTSATPLSVPTAIFARRRTDGLLDNYAPYRAAFYSIGAALSLSALDARVTTYMTSITRPSDARRRRQSGGYGL